MLITVALFVNTMGYAAHRMRCWRFFLAGAVIGALLCNVAREKAIWATLLPPGVLLAIFLHADLVSEKSMMGEKPAGH